MSVITYTAKRRIEEIAYFKVGTDISAAAIDDSFNSVTTDLSGLLAFQWIEVSGFANAQNIGWFQADADSTANKITQNVVDALVDEAAGPEITIQGHKRGLDQQYSLEFTPRRLDKSAPEIVRDEVRALDRSAEAHLHAIETFWDVVTGRILEADILQWEEFLASVAALEPFTFDPYGTIAVPDNPVSVELASTRHPHARIGNIRRYTIPLRMRVIE